MHYQAKTDEISFTKLGRHYAQVSFAQKDFDRFYVPSYSNETARDSANITVDLGNQKLVVRGITEVMVSDSLKANFIPSDKQIVFSRGRDFDFQGEIRSGITGFEALGLSLISVHLRWISLKSIRLPFFLA
jgi:hypothetical protein